MDKPLSLSVKQFLIRRMSVDMAISEKVIETVINHQFTGMLDQMKTSSSVELSGFGKFLFNSKKAVRMMQKYNANKKINEDLLLQDLTPQKRRNVNMRIEYLTQAIEDLKPRINED